MNAYDSLMRIRLLMGYKVGVPLNEQKLTWDDDNKSKWPDKLEVTTGERAPSLLDEEKYVELFTRLDDIKDRMSYWEPTKPYSGFNNDVTKYIEILESLKVLKPYNPLYYSFSLQTAYTKYFQNSSLVNHPCDKDRIENLTPATLIFDTIYLDWLISVNPNSGNYKSNCLRPADPLFNFTKPLQSISSGVEKVEAYVKPKTPVDDAKSEFDLVMSKIPSDYNSLPIFNYFETNPFSSSEENNQFRKWYNTRFPKTSSLIKLDSSDKAKQNKYTSNLKTAVNQIIDYGRESIFAFYVYDNLAKKDKKKYLEWWEYFSPKMMQTGEIMNKINEQKKLFIEKNNSSKTPESLNQRLEMLWNFGNDAEKNGITTSIYPSIDWSVDVEWDWSSMQSRVYLQYKPTSEKCGFKIQVNYTKQVNTSNFVGQSLGMESVEINQKYVAQVDFKANGNIVEIFANGKKVTGTYWKEGDYIKVLFPGYPNITDLSISGLNYMLTEELDLIPNDEKNKNKATELYDKSQEQWNIKNQAFASGSNVPIEGDLSLNPCYPAFQKKLDELKGQGKDINKKEVRVEAWTEFVKCMESGLTGEEYNKNEQLESESTTLETLLKNRFVIKNWTSESSINKDSHGAYSESEVREAWDENGQKGKDFLINVSKGQQHTQSENPKIIGKCYYDNKTGKYFIPWENIPTGGEGSPWVYKFYDAHPIISQIIPSILAAVFTGSLAAPAATRVILYAALESGINIAAAYLDYATGNIGDDYMYIYVDIIFAILPVVIALPSVQSLLHGKFNAYSVDSLAKKIASDIKPGTPREVIEYYIKNMLTAEERQVLAYVCKYEQGLLFREFAKQGKFGESLKKLKKLYGDPPKLPKTLFDDLFKKVSKTVEDIPVKKTYGNVKEFSIYLSPTVIMAKDLGLLFKLGYCYVLDWKDSLECFQKEMTEDEKQETLKIIEQIGEDEFKRLIDNKQYKDLSEKIIDIYGEGAMGGTFGKKDEDGDYVLPDGQKFNVVVEDIMNILDNVKKRDKIFCGLPINYDLESDDEKTDDLMSKGFCGYCTTDKYYHCKSNYESLDSDNTTTTTTIIQ